MAEPPERRLADGAESRWIFGYGSLVWRPAIPFLERRPATLPGFARRFWQGSTDHRGNPSAPGRVVTLVAAAQDACVGMAYRVAPEAWEEVLERLDFRERGGYSRLTRELRLHRPDGAVARALVYVATATNPNYLGPASDRSIAEQVLASAGPSGTNPEYVLALAEALRSLDARDAHVFAIEALVRVGLQASAEG